MESATIQNTHENPPAHPPAARPERLASIDALRGFDMFWIIGGNPLVLAFLGMFFDPVPQWLEYHFEHVKWEGFSAWDLIMPLFLFVSGVSLPFSLAKWTGSSGKGKDRKALYIRLARRILLLWVLGMLVQGNLLRCDLSRLHLYSNTLQSIATGYLVATLLLLFCSIRGQLAAAVALLLGYWGLMVLVPVPGHGAGVLEPHANLALYIDEVILGRFRDGTTYTWILSGMGFAVSVLLGVFGGHVLRSDQTKNRKAAILFASGIGCLAAGWIWGLAFPIIKHIWTSSMVLWAGGWSYLLLALFYWLIDVKQYRKWAFPFIVIGMNAIAVYVATSLISFRRISEDLVGHIAEHLGVAGPFLVTLTAFMIVWLILLYLYRKGTFIRA
ncbi:MAG TPA: DUF5009 domain-containing protein [Candidatus Hydrogenedentes bacterium]|nr:DUF5009 domain-containing protein [Candidatus Hydrogenedentota bacterium]